jgi:hypothetical protein
MQEVFEKDGTFEQRQEEWRARGRHEQQVAMAATARAAQKERASLRATVGGGGRALLPRATAGGGGGELQQQLHGQLERLRGSHAPARKLMKKQYTAATTTAAAGAGRERRGFQQHPARSKWFSPAFGEPSRAELRRAAGQVWRLPPSRSGVAAQASWGRAWRTQSLPVLLPSLR